jgi:hypothetical protein
MQEKQLTLPTMTTSNGPILIPQINKWTSKQGQPKLHETQMALKATNKVGRQQKAGISCVNVELC